MKFFVYKSNLIDNGFENLKTVEETRSFFELNRDKLGCSVENFDDNWEDAIVAAKRKGLFGEYRHEPHVFWLPIQDRFDCGFIIKQHENGVTYVISPFELSYLEES